MTHPIVMDVIARDNASKTFKQVAQSQTTLAKQTDGLSKNNDNLRKSQLQLVAAQERYNKVAKDSSTSAGKLASAQASLITAQQRVKKATNEAGKAAENTAEKHAGMASNMKLAAGAAGALVAVKVVGFLKSAVSAASDLNETQSKSNVIFGSNAKAINDWASTAATKLGLSRQAALDAASGFGDMFSQLGFNATGAAKMSKQVVQLATDLGSFNNLPTATVLEMIAGGFRGEYDSLQRVIPNISAARVQQEALNETHKRSATELTAAEKATATLNIIMKDGARATGDFARTSGGLANQQKIAAARVEDLKASIGKSLQPAIISILKVASGLVAVFDKFSGIIIPLGGLLVTFGAAVWAINKATAAWEATQLALNTVLGETRAKALIPLLGPLALGVAAFGALYFAAGKLTQAISGTDEAMVKAASRGIKDFNKALQDSGGVFDANTQHILANTLVTGGYVEKAAKAHITVDQLTKGVTGNDEAMQNLVETWRASGDPSEVTIGSLRRLHEQFQQGTAAGLQNADAQNKVNQAAGAMKGGLDAASVAAANQKAFLAANNLTLDDAKKKYNDAVTSAHTFTAELGYMSNALATLSGNNINATLQQDALNLAMGTAADKFAGSRAQVAAHGKALQGNTADAISNRDWALQQIQAINQQAISYATSTGSIGKGTQALGTNIEALKTSMRQAGFTKGEIDKLIATYAATPSDVETSIREQGSQAVLAALGDILNQLHAIADPVWGAKFDFAMNNPSLKRGFARGGPVTGPGTGTSDSIPAWLSSGEYVVNAAATQKHLGLLENINRSKYAGGGLVGNLNINTMGLASEANQFGTVLGGALADAAKRAAAEIAKQAAKAGGIPGAPGSIPANVSAYQAYAGQLMAQMGMQSLGSLIALWNGESGWNPNALNASSGAYGIPQALPADKMASAGADWHSNAQTQIRWGLGYIRDRYGSPDAAWSFWQSQSPHWYGKGMAPTVFRRPTLIGVGEHGPETVSVSRGIGGGGVAVNVNVYAAQGMSAEQIGRQVAVQVRAVFDDQARRAAKGGRA